MLENPTFGRLAASGRDFGRGTEKGRMGLVISGWWLAGSGSYAPRYSF